MAKKTTEITSYFDDSLFQTGNEYSGNTRISDQSGNAIKVIERLESDYIEREKKERKNILPFLEGSRNQSALGKTIPYVMGRVKFSPYKLNDGIYTIGDTDGYYQYLSLLLCCGYNNQRIEKIKIADKTIFSFDINDAYQDKVLSLPESIWQNRNGGDAKLEISNNAPLYLQDANKKAISTKYNDTIKYNEPVIKTLSGNVHSVSVCIKFDGLRLYNKDTETYGPREIEIVPYWSNDNGSTWHKFYFDITNETKYSYKWTTLTSTRIDSAVKSGYIVKEKQRVQIGPSNWCEVYNYRAISADYRVTMTGGTINTSTGADSRTWKIEKRTKQSITKYNTIERNVAGTIRFTADITFLASESYGKEIQIKVERKTAELTDNASSSDACVLQYITTYCYDADKSSSTKLVACDEMENPFRDMTTRIAIKALSNSQTENTLDELSIITNGCARIYSNNAWTSYKTPTRNPASWILAILTSEYHQRSLYEDSEIDLISLGKLYNYCDANNFYCDGVVTNGIKKQDLINSILDSVNAAMVVENGKLVFYYDDKVEESSGLLNSQDIISATYKKSFARRIKGYKETYILQDSWEEVTELVTKNNETYNIESDTLLELNLDFIETHEHAQKYAIRKLKKQELQPTSLSLRLGKYAKNYKLFDVLNVQLDQFYIGLCSSVIHSWTTTNGKLKSIVIGDRVVLESGKRYGVIIQAQNENGYRLIESEVTGDTGVNTKTLNLLADIDFNDADSVSVQYGNIISFGELDSDGKFTKVSKLMKITDISRNEEEYILEMKDYNEDIYNYGTIPEYKSNITKRPSVEVKEVPLTLAQAADASTGKSGSSMRSRGTWESGKSYECNENYLDIVFYSETGCSYICKLSHTSSATITPDNSTYWDKLVDKGTSGSVRVLSSLNESGYEGEVGVYKLQLYIFSEGSWVIANSESYLGVYSTLPSFQLGAYFLCGSTFGGVSAAIALGDYVLEVNGLILTVNRTYQKGKIYLCTNDGWKIVNEENDYRYLVASMDLLTVSGNLPPSLSNQIDTQAEAKADTAESNAKDYADGVGESTLSDSKEYADGVGTSTLNSAKADTTKQIKDNGLLGTCLGVSAQKTPSATNIGDYYMFNSDQTVADRKNGYIYRWNGTSYVELDPNNPQTYDAYMSALKLCLSASNLSSGAFATLFCESLAVNNAFISKLTSDEAFIESIFTRKIVMKTTGSQIASIEFDDDGLSLSSRGGKSELNVRNMYGDEVYLGNRTASSYSQWDSSTTYTVGTIVWVYERTSNIHSPKLLYKCIKENKNRAIPNETYWRYLGKETGSFVIASKQTLGCINDPAIRVFNKGESDDCNFTNELDIDHSFIQTRVYDEEKGKQVTGGTLHINEWKGEVDVGVLYSKHEELGDVIKTCGAGIISKSDGSLENTLKFDNGIIIKYGLIPISCMEGQSGCYRTSGTAGTYLVVNKDYTWSQGVFTDYCRISFSFDSYKGMDQGGIYSGSIASESSKTGFTYKINRDTSASSIEGYLHYIAIGK